MPGLSFISLQVYALKHGILIQHWEVYIRNFIGLYTLGSSGAGTAQSHVYF